MSGSSAVPGYGYGVAEPIPDILWLKLNETSGTTAADSSSGGNPFTVLNSGNCFWITPGASGSGGAISNDGTNVAGIGSSTANINFGTANVITVCLWVKLTVLGGNDAIVMELTTNSNSNDNAFFIDYRQNDSPKTWQLSIHSGTGSLQGKIPAPAAGAWHHVAIVFDNSTDAGLLKAYTDSVVQTVTGTLATKSSHAAFITSKLYIANRGLASLPTTVDMDDVRIYSRELTAAEVVTVYADPQ